MVGRRGNAPALRRAGVLAWLVLVLPAVAAQPEFAFEREKAPAHDMFEFFPICSTHGASQMIAVGQGGRTPFETIVRGINGTTGEWEWLASARNWWNTPPNPAIPPPLYEGPRRAGWPAPSFPWWGNVQPTVDLDGDGYCDFVAYGWDMPQRTSAVTIEYDWYLGAYSGRHGDAIWETSDRSIVYDDRQLFRLHLFPTGLLVYHDPDAGPRFVLKLTNTTYSYTASLWLLVQDAYRLGASDSGHLLWTWDHLQVTGGYVRTSRITGVADVQGDREMEVFLEHWAPGGGPDDFVSMSVLRGDVELPADPLRALDARVLWGPTSCYRPPTSGNDPKQRVSEETQEVFLFQHHRLVGDVDPERGKGRSAPDAVCTYLTLGQDPSSENGRFQLHIQPLRGETGEPFWPHADIKQQGYGFVSDLNEPPAFRYERWGSLPTGAPADETHPLLALGTADLPSVQLRGARFPLKETRLTTLRTDDGAPIWGTRSWPLVQDDYMSLDWALLQFATTLAGRDLDGDGVRELLSPARYQVPGERDQRLLSTVRHDYGIVGGRSGRVLTSIETWGPRGMLVDCPGQATTEVTAIAGHARRLDVARWHEPALDLAWREPYYVNGRAQAQTSGTNLYFLMPRCADVPDGRTMFGWIQGTYSLRRRGEELAVYGFQNATGGAHWIQPELTYRPPLNGTLTDFRSIAKPATTAQEAAALASASVACGVGAAFATVALARRARGRHA